MKLKSGFDLLCLTVCSRQTLGAVKLQLELNQMTQRHHQMLKEHDTMYEITNQDLGY